MRARHMLSFARYDNRAMNAATLVIAALALVVLVPLGALVRSRDLRSMDGSLLPARHGHQAFVGVIVLLEGC